AVLGLDARQQRGVALHRRAPAIDAPRANAGRNILLERLVEGVTLAAVETEHGRILRNPTERGGDHALRDAGGCRIRRDVLHEGVEIAAAAGGGGGGGGGEDDAEQNCQMKLAHAIPLWLPDGPDHAMRKWRAAVPSPVLIETSSS